MEIRSLSQVTLLCCSCTQCFPRAPQCFCYKMPQEGKKQQNTVVFHVQVIKRKYNCSDLKALGRKGALSATICWQTGERKCVGCCHLRDLPTPQLHRCSPEKTFLLLAALSQRQCGNTETASGCIPTQNSPVCLLCQPISERNRQELKERCPEQGLASGVLPQGILCTQKNFLVSQYEPSLFLPWCFTLTCLAAFLMVFLKPYIRNCLLDSSFRLCSHRPQSTLSAILTFFLKGWLQDSCFSFPLPSCPHSTNSNFCEELAFGMEALSLSNHRAISRIVSSGVFGYSKCPYCPSCFH